MHHNAYVNIANVFISIVTMLICNWHNIVNSELKLTKEFFPTAMAQCTEVNCGSCMLVICDHVY